MASELRTVTFSMALTLTLSLGASVAQAADPIGTYRTASGLSDKYRDMGTTIAQIETVRRIPFFNLSVGQRLENISDFNRNVRSGDLRSAAGAIRRDFNGGLVKDLATIVLTDILTKVSRGQDLDTAMDSTIKSLTGHDFLFGNLLGGTLGAMAGALLPVPAMGGLLGQMASTLPMLAGAMLGTTVALNVLHGHTAFDGIDPLSFSCQAVGSTIGMVLGSLVPVPRLGPIVFGAFGGTLGLRLAERLRQGSGQNGGPQQDSTPASVESAAPQAPQTSTQLAGGDLPTLRKSADELYSKVVRAASSGDRAAAANGLAEYRTARFALASAR